MYMCVRWVTGPAYKRRRQPFQEMCVFEYIRNALQSQGIMYSRTIYLIAYLLRHWQLVVLATTLYAGIGQWEWIQ